MRFRRCLSNDAVRIRLFKELVFFQNLEEASERHVVWRDDLSVERRRGDTLARSQFNAELPKSPYNIVRTQAIDVPFHNAADDLRAAWPGGFPSAPGQGWQIGKEIR